MPADFRGHGPPYEVFGLKRLDPSPSAPDVKKAVVPGALMNLDFLSSSKVGNSYH